MEALKEKMTQQKALEVMVAAIRFAQSKGVYSLEDSGTILEALEAFKTENRDGEEQQERSEA